MTDINNPKPEEKKKIDFGDIYISQLSKDGTEPKVVAALTSSNEWVGVEHGEEDKQTFPSRNLNIKNR